MAIAIICDEYVNHINETIQNPDDPEDTITRDDGFEDDLVQRAQAIWNAATAFDTHKDSEFAFYEMYGNEAAFLAHINLFQEADEVSAQLNEMTVPELHILLGQRLSDMAQVLYAWTQIGRDLNQSIESIRNCVSAKLGLSRPPSNTP